MKLLLDTDICIAVLRGKDPELERKLKSQPISLFELPSIVVAELWVGVYKSAHPANAEERLLRLLRDLPVAPFDEVTAKKYGEIRSILEKKGISIGANEMLIAATALHRGGKLITRKRREYQRVPGLEIEVW